jgi:hypothetical protein
LVVIALSNEEDEKVAEYLDSMDIQVRVASGFKANAGYPSRGIPASFLVGADGKILWKGHPSSLNSGMIKDALKGVKKSSNSYMSFSTQTKFDDKAVSNFVDGAAKGKMGKALKDARALIAKADGSAEQAKQFEAELVAYSELLRQQSEVFITKSAMVTGTEVLAAIAKEFKGLDVGEAATQRLAEIDSDETLSLEWKADKALNKAKAYAAKKGIHKSVKKFEDVAKKFKGTATAKKAHALARKGRQPKN